MTLLRIIDLNVINSTLIQIKFSDELSDNLSINNFLITNIKNDIVKILNITISDNVVEIYTQPMQPYTKYYLKLISPFFTANGTAILNSSNSQIEFVSFEDDSLPQQSNLLKYLEKNIYDLTWPSFERHKINAQAKLLAQAYFAIKELKNDNYLELLITNELKVRGDGPFDRLNEGGAFEIVKITKNLSEDLFENILHYTSFPFYPVNLQQETITETINPIFNDFIFETKKYPILSISKILFIYQDDSYLEYDIKKLGYQINDNTFDQNYAFSYLLLNKNQVKLNKDILDYGRLPSPNEKIQITYSYQNLGNIIKENSVELFQVKESIREITPPITTNFYLKYAPIITENLFIPELSGILFLDPKANPPFSKNHPAFQIEKKFDLNALPSSYGEYCVNYETGQVIVYGDSEDQGTGEYPPVATYLYQKKLLKNIDYTYNNSTYQVVISPLRNLDGEDIYIKYNFEKTLIPNIDFIAQVHTEVLNERVENKITSTNSLKTKYAPITNVFRVINETTGEIYSVSRWNDDTIYFSGTSPRLSTESQESVEFQQQEEILNLSSIITKNNLNIYVFQLSQYPVINKTNSGIGSSYNTSVILENELFHFEKYYDWQTDTLDNQLSDLISGQYLIDYHQGKIYLAIIDQNNFNFGSAIYKYGKIKTNFKHIYGVNKLYYAYGPSLTVAESIKIDQFSDTLVTPLSYRISDERFKDDNALQSYVVDSDTILVSNLIDTIYGIYDLYDLKNNLSPINFAIGATHQNKTIYLSPIDYTVTAVILDDFSIKIEKPFVGLEINSIQSVTYNYIEYWDSNGSIDEFTLHLSGANNPEPGQIVTIKLKYKLNGAATPIIDYIPGKFLIDYTYIADEILISYEYGDNLLNFSSSSVLESGETYYVSYKVGALRQALLQNFGLLFNIPLLNQLNFSLTREEYRDCLKAALGIVTKGPTLNALKNLVSQITHIEPRIIEDLFQGWFLGSGYLYYNDIFISGNPEVVPGKFDGGILIKKDQWIEISPTSNLSLEQGSFQTWIIPEWQPLDNDAVLKCKIYKNGNLINYNKIYIGSFGKHPQYNSSGEFIIQKSQDTIGLPNQIFLEEGFFIYFDLNENKWKFLAKAGASESNTYTGNISSSGGFYGVKHIQDLGELDDWIRSYESTLEFELNINSEDAILPDGYTNDGYVEGYSFDGFEFMSDNQHYIFDVGEPSKNRMSLFKDIAGFFVFKVLDKFGQSREISANIKHWKAQELHHVACSWQINSVDQRDELHLFIDGQEVPNLLKFGGKPPIVYGDTYRAVKPEIILSSVTKPSILETDLQSFGTNTVTSTNTNFEELGILVGDTILLIDSNEEYTITNVNNYTLTLNESLSFTLDKIKYSINPVSFELTTQAALYTNFILSVIRDGQIIELPGVRAENPSYKISTNYLFKNILTIYGNLQKEDQISLYTVGLNHQKISKDIYLWSPKSIFQGSNYLPMNLNEVSIIAILLPLTTSTVQTAEYLGGNSWKQIYNLSQPSNTIEGRKIQIKINSSNIDFTTPAIITINGSATEILYFSKNEVKTSSLKFNSLDNIVIECNVNDNTKSLFSIEVTELNSIFVSEDNENYPILSYSYIFQKGNNLSSTGNQIKDENVIFLDSIIGNYIELISPVNKTAKILSKTDDHTLILDTDIGIFSEGIYNIYYLVHQASFQNGFLTLQNVNDLGPYILPTGTYRLTYSTYLSIPFESFKNQKMILGNNLNHTKPANCVLDEIKTSRKILKDLRIGETAISGQNYVTIDYLSLIPLRPDKYTLMLLSCNKLPLINESYFYTSFNDIFLQSSDSVNEYFGSSFIAAHNGLSIDNNGVINNNEGGFEFWVSPKYDTVSDFNERYYFDAVSYAQLTISSISSTHLKLPISVRKIVAIYSINENGHIIENFVENARLGEDFKTIFLSKPLPYTKTTVKIIYIPKQLTGNRISIYKNKFSYLTIKVISGEDEFIQQIPVVWPRHSWHKIVVNYTFNSTNSYLQILCDGQNSGLIKFGDGFLFGDLIFGQAWFNSSTELKKEIFFQDQIQEFYLGSDYLNKNLAQARIDNFKISNKPIKLWNVNNQIVDVSYSQNVAYPSVEDLYTAYIFNFDSIFNRIEDFTLLKDSLNGNFNFTLDIIDSFDIVKNNDKIKEILENLIKLFKPAFSKTKINYL